MINPRGTVNIEDIVAKPTDFVDEKWDLLVKFFRQRDRVNIVGPARVSKGVSFGCRVEYDAENIYRPNFSVSVTGRRARISPGLVNNEVPVIGSVDLEGYDVVQEKQTEIPELEIKGEYESGRSFICLRVGVDASGRPAAAPFLSWAAIEHVRDLKQVRLDRAPYEGFQPLAILYWQGGRIIRGKQVVTLNLQHSVNPAGQHFFSGF